MQERKDLTGNVLALDLTIEGRRVTLITLYGPNSDNPTFYENLTETIYAFDNESYIICGDFNSTLNPILDNDKSYKHINNPKARDKITELKYKKTTIFIYGSYKIRLYKN